LGQPADGSERLLYTDIFQDSISLPRPRAVAEELADLLAIKPETVVPAAGTVADSQRIAESLFAQLSTATEILARLVAAEKKTQASIEELRRAAILRMESADVQERLEHMLMSFAPLLLDQSRKSFKRFVNSVDIELYLQVLEGRSIGGDERRLSQLALWIILRQRWPSQAAFLEGRPQALNRVPEMIDLQRRRTQEVADLTKHLEQLIRDQDALDVLRGKGVGVSLDADALTSFVSFPSSHLADLQVRCNWFRYGEASTEVGHSF
jgi:hypothetical protein